MTVQEYRDFTSHLYHVARESCGLVGAQEKRQWVGRVERLLVVAQVSQDECKRATKADRLKLWNARADLAAKYYPIQALVGSPE